ncbi:MAG: ribosome-associated translation inhibitor RaiA [Bacilli bacterium]|nr:ribosome-associated translation inhibitor RaiA [Bacilli bacterium]
MLIKVRGEKVKITPAIDSYVKEKLGKLDKYFENPDVMSASVLVRIRGVEQIVEVTIPIKNAVLRAEERCKDLYATIDLVVDKLERQIRKNKTKIKKKKNRVLLPEFNLDFDEEDTEEVKNKIVKEKTIDTKPMSKEEAILQMELVGHDFFVFKDDVSLNVCVVYKRRDGNYGVITAK